MSSDVLLPLEASEPGEGGRRSVEWLQRKQRTVASDPEHGDLALKGTVQDIQLGDVLAHITVRVGENVIESVITRRSAEEMALKKGDSVTAVVKATEVMIAKP